MLLAAATVAVALALLRAILPNRPDAGLLAGSLVAFNPQSLFISSVANNDNLLSLCWTACLAQLVRIVLAPRLAFPVLPAGAALAAVSAASMVPASSLRVVGAGTALVLGSASSYMLFGVILPTYDG